MKRQYTNYELKELVKSIFEDENNDFSITAEDENEEITSAPSIVDYLNIEFYSYKKDLRTGDYLDVYDTDSINNWVKSLNVSMNKGFASVELTNNTPMTAYDLDGGTVNGKVSIIIQTDRVANLDFYITWLRNKYVGQFEDIISNGTTYTSHIVIGVLDVSEVYQCALGQCITATFDISISYLEKADTYQDENIEFSFDNTTYYSVPISRLTKSIVFTGKTETRQNTPTTAGTVNSSVSSVYDLTYWLLNSNTFIKDLDYDMEKEACYSYQRTTPSVEDPYAHTEGGVANFIIWVRTKKKNGSGVEYTFTYKTIITSYTKQYVNNDMTVVSLKLNTCPIR